MVIALKFHEWTLVSSKKSILPSMKLIHVDLFQEDLKFAFFKYILFIELRLNVLTECFR